MSQTSPLAVIVAPDAQVPANTLVVRQYDAARFVIEESDTVIHLGATGGIEVATPVEDSIKAPAQRAMMAAQTYSYRSRSGHEYGFANNNGQLVITAR